MLLAMIAADQPAPIEWLQPQIPEGLERIVLACLEKDPEARPRSVVDLAGLLAPFGTRDSEAVLARIARTATRTTRPPPLPSSIPGGPASRRNTVTSRVPSSVSTRAIVRSTPPLVAEAQSARLPGWALLVGGALIGVSGALTAALFLRPMPAAPAPVAATQPAAEPVAAGPAAPPTSPAPAPTAAPEPPAAAGTAATTARQPATPEAAAAQAPAPRPAPAKPKPKPRPLAEDTPEPTAEQRSTALKPEAKAPAKALFGSID